MLSPLEIPFVRDKILKLVGPHHARHLRLVAHSWNQVGVGILAANDWSVRVSPESVDEYCESQLLRPNFTAQLKISVDFGHRPTLAQFHHLIDTVTNTILQEEGPGCVKKLTFRGRGDSFKLGEQEWSKLLSFVQLLSPGLQSMCLFDVNCPIGQILSPTRRYMLNLTHPQSPLLDDGHFYGPFRLSFPNLVQLSVCLEPETKYLLLHGFLRLGVMPQLCKLKIAAVPENELYGLSLSDNKALHKILPQLTELSCLKELSFNVDSMLSFELSGNQNLVALSTVHRLHLHILRDGTGWSTVTGTFIRRLCPQLQHLDLEYEPLLGHSFSELTWFPHSIGQLPFLHSLTYRKKDNVPSKARQDPSIEIQHQQLNIGEPQLLRNEFSSIQNISVHLDSELHHLDHKTVPKLQFPTVSRLEIQIPVEASTIIGSAAFSKSVLERLVANLSELYPNVICLALDLRKLLNTSTIVTTIKLLLKQVFSRPSRLEELQLLNCGFEIELGQVFLEVLEDPVVCNSFRFIRRLRLSNGIYRRNFDFESTNVPPPPPWSSATVANLVLEFPQLQSLDVDMRFGRVEVADMKLYHPNLKINFNFGFI